MLVQSARITLKQHQFGVGTGALAAILLAAMALWVNTRLVAATVPATCFDPTLGPAEVANCDRLFQEHSTIYAEAGTIFGWMAILPWVAGLLAGVTVVGRELEARTAQTAWALAASRRRWFGRQLWPILLVLGVSVGFAAIAASGLTATRAVRDTYLWLDLGVQGPLVVARAFVALGVGVMAGAALGRTLPAFIVGAVLSVALVVGSVEARHAWVDVQPHVIFEQATVESRDFRGGISIEQGWRLPDGSVLPDSEARSLAPSDVSVDPNQWLLDQGYEVVQIGLTADTVGRWEPLEIAGTTLIGVLLVLATVVVVDRRRPT